MKRIEIDTSPASKSVEQLSLDFDKAAQSGANFAATLQAINNTQNPAVNIKVTSTGLKQVQEELDNWYKTSANASKALGELEAKASGFAGAKTNFVSAVAAKDKALRTLQTTANNTALGLDKVSAAQDRALATLSERGKGLGSIFTGAQLGLLKGDYTKSTGVMQGPQRQPLAPQFAPPPNYSALELAAYKTSDKDLLRLRKYVMLTDEATRAIAKQASLRSRIASVIKTEIASRGQLLRVYAQDLLAATQRKASRLEEIANNNYLSRSLVTLGKNYVMAFSPASIKAGMTALKSLNLDAVTGQLRIGTGYGKAIQNIGSTLKQAFTVPIDPMKKTNQALLEYNKATLIAAHGSEQMASRMNAAWKFWLRFAVAQTVHRAIYALIRQIRDGIRATADIEKRISEIRTISQDVQLPFEQWFEGAKRLSDEFGSTLEDTIEGTYQAISNQIAKGADAFIFMRNAMEFARASVTSTENSVNLLSSALNAYGLSAVNSTEVSAILFKMIELGRVRADEVADSFGRVAVIAAQLGVPLKDLAAGIAQLTIQGKKPAVVMTELRNIFLKLISPTEEMTAIFKTWGVDTGQMAIKTFGFIGVINKLNEEFLRLEAEGIGKGTEQMNDFFNSIRAINGILGLTGNKAEAFNQTLKDFNGAIQYYSKATQIAVESLGKQLQIQANQVRNYFIAGIGRSFLEVVQIVINGAAKITGNTRSLLTLTKLFIDALKALVAIYAGYRIALAMTSTEQGVIITLLKVKLGLMDIEIAKIREKEIEMLQLGHLEASEHFARLAQQKQELAQLASFRATSMVKVLGITALIATAIAMLTHGIRKWLETSSAASELEKNIKDGTEVNLAYAKSIEKINEDAEKVSGGLQKVNQQFLQLTARRKTMLTPEIEELTKGIKEGQDALGSFVESIIGMLENRVRVIGEAIKAIVSRLKESEKIVDKINTGKINESFYDTLVQNIGKVDEAWEKARVRLLDYQATLEQKGKFVQPEPGQKPTEMQTFARQFEIYKQYVQLIAGGFQEAIKTDNLDTARESFEKILGLTERLREFGFSYNEILKRRLLLIESYKQAELVIQANNRKRLEQAQALEKQEKARLEIIKALYDELKGIKFTEKDFSKQMDVYKSVINDLYKEIAKTSSPEISAKIQAIIGGVEETERIGLLTSKIENISTGSIKSVDQFKAAATSKLAEIATLINKQNELAILDKQAAESTKRLDALLEEQKKFTDLEKERVEKQKSSKEELTALLNEIGRLQVAIKPNEFGKFLGDIASGLNTERLGTNVFGEASAVGPLNDILGGYINTFASLSREQQKILIDKISETVKWDERVISKIDNLASIVATGKPLARPAGEQASLNKLLGILSVIYTSKISEPVPGLKVIVDKIEAERKIQAKLVDELEELVATSEAIRDQMQLENQEDTTGTVSTEGRDPALMKRLEELRQQLEKSRAAEQQNKEELKTVAQTLTNAQNKNSESTTKNTDVMNKFFDKETKTTEIKKGLPGLGGLRKDDIFKTFELGLGGNTIGQTSQDWTRKLWKGAERKISPTQQLPAFIGTLPEHVSIPSWQDQFSRKTIDPSRTLAPTRPAPQINNRITIYVDGKEITGKVVESIEKGSKRGQNNIMTEPNNTNPWRSGEYEVTPGVLQTPYGQVMLNKR